MRVDRSTLSGDWNDRSEGCFAARVRPVRLPPAPRRTSAAYAQDNLKIGVIATLSGPAAVIGQQLRNGFELAVKTLGGKLGGRDTEILVADDELKPDVAVTKVKALVDRDKVDFVVGPIFSNVLGAIKKPVTEANVILISPNAGSSSFRRQGLQSELLRHLLSERSGPRGARPIRQRDRHQESDHHRRRTIRLAKTPLPVSSTSSRAKFSTKSTYRSASLITRPSCRGSRPQVPTRSLPSSQGAWA